MNVLKPIDEQPASSAAELEELLTLIATIVIRLLQQEMERPANSTQDPSQSGE